jgi:hypothetical protein
MHEPANTARKASVYGAILSDRRFSVEVLVIVVTGLRLSLLSEL